VSCPDWRVLRDDDASSEAAETARRHLGECRECRQAALAFDPTLLFSLSSPPTPVARAMSSEAMIERMRERVAGARAMQQAPPAAARQRRLRGVSRVAAAVLLPLAGLGLVAAGLDRLQDASLIGPGDQVAIRPTAAAPVDPLLAEALARLPLIEGSAPVTVQEEGIGYDLVMVVDAGLEL
jgi:hypothetical protein